MTKCFLKNQSKKTIKRENVKKDKLDNNSEKREKKRKTFLKDLSRILIKLRFKIMLTRNKHKIPINLIMHLFYFLIIIKYLILNSNKCVGS